MDGLGRFYGMGFGSHHGYSWDNNIINLVLFAACIIGFVLLVRWIVNKNSTEFQSASFSPEDSPKEIVQKRYASGEISKDEFDLVIKNIDIQKE